MVYYVLKQEALQRLAFYHSRVQTCPDVNWKV